MESNVFNLSVVMEYRMFSIPSTEPEYKLLRGLLRSRKDEYISIKNSALYYLGTWMSSNNPNKYITIKNDLIWVH